MKKVITILMIICIMLCGCSKEEPKTSAPVTQAPATPTVAPTEVPADPTPTTTIEELAAEVEAEVQEAHHQLDVETYAALCNMIMVNSTKEEALQDVDGMDGIITIDPSGISFKDIPDSFMISLLNLLGDDFTGYKTYGEYTIKVSQADFGGIAVTKVKAP